MVNIINPESRHLFREITKHERVQKYLQELREHHSETHGHSLRVGLLSIDLGYENGISGTNLRHVGYGGLLHDIGKLRVPAKILAKPSELDSEELDLMKGHPRLGFLELQDLGYETVRQIVVAHHEYKKHPYPRTGTYRRKQDREQGDRRYIYQDINEMAQIVAVSDIYDAMASRRAYQEPIVEPTEIERILREQFTGENLLIDQILARHNLTKR